MLELRNLSPELYLYHQADDKEFSEIYSFVPDSTNVVGEFHEPFTDTYSWVYLKKRYTINEEGNYYVRIKEEFFKYSRQLPTLPRWFPAQYHWRNEP